MAVHPLPEESNAHRHKAVRRPILAPSMTLREHDDEPADPGSTAGPRLRLIRLPGYKRRWWIEVLVVLVGYQVYEWTQGVAPSHPGLAERNGTAIWRAEQWLHIAPERWLNHALTDVPALAAFAGYYYLALNFTVPIGLLIWLYVKRQQHYARLRWILTVITGIALLCFWLVPVSPPRFVVPGTIDTVVTSHLIGAAYQDEIAPHANLYAAMPSLHVAWAGWCTVAALIACRRTWVRALFCAYPFVTTLDILATANHYVLDAVAGAATLGLSWGIVALVPRLHGRSRERMHDSVSIRKQ